MSTLAKQCRTKAESAGYTALMNDTKWKELCAAFSTCSKKPAWRTLDLLNGHLSQWDSEWFYHVGPDYCAIEWMEIDPRDCSKGVIEAVLRQVGVSFESSGTLLKVFGYR